MPSMDPAEIETYAKGIAAALRVIGPTPRDRVLGMLRGLNLSAGDAVMVLDYAVARGILAEGGDAGHVHVPSRRRAARGPIVTPQSPRRRPAVRARASAYVLVIEDDDVLRGAMCEALADRGYATVAALNCAQALQVLAREGRPSVAFVDLLTSGLDGAEVLDRLRAAPACAALPVIAVAGTPARPQAAGTTFLTKPITAATLVREVGKFAVPFADGA